MLLISYILQIIIDTINTGDIKDFKNILILTIITLLSLALVMLINTFVYPKFIYRSTRQYKEYAFKRIIEKDIKSFKKQGSSLYISSLTNDLNQIENNYIASMFTLVLEVVSFFGALSLMFWYSRKLTFIALLLALLPLLFTVIYGNKLQKYEKNVSNKNENFVHFVKDCLSGFTTIKSFKAEEKIRELFEKRNFELENAKEKRKRAEELLSMSGQLTGIFAQLGVFLFGAYLSIKGEAISAGVVVVFIQLMNFVVNPISSVPNIFAKRKASIPLIEKLASASLKEHISEEKNFMAKLENGISLKDLSFSYDNKTILDNVSYFFEANKSYAIIGESGSGKSTLLNLLMGSLNNYSGKILYDDLELSTLKDSSLSNLISVIEQNVFVFDSSVIKNITMYDEFSSDEINSVIKRSGLTNFIKEKGLDYQCGEGGKNLSGGEKQRISIARGLLKNSKLLLMDEATSALDSETSINVSQEIIKLKNITKIIITHRLESSVLKSYDEIIVMKNGKIAENGTFSSLIEKEGLFYSIYNIAQD